MATDPEEVEYIPDDEGGPTKTFLEHLEDLRWILMKCSAAIAVGFLICLFASPVIVKILTWPLNHMDDNVAANAISRVFHLKQHDHSQNTPTVTFFMGTNKLGMFNLQTNQANLFGTNLDTVFELAPITVGSNVVLGLQPSTNKVEVVRGDRRPELINLGPATAFFLAVEMALYGGITLASPFLLYFIGSFVFPALRMKEKKYTFQGLGFGMILFLIGISFCYFVLMPVALKASMQYSEWMGFSAYQWRAEDYIRFVSKFILGMGLGFELPIVILVLVKIGLIGYSQLAAFRRYMIVVCLVLGAVLTTPEVITQILMAIPLYLLYETTIWIAWYWEWKERRKREAGK